LNLAFFETKIGQPLRDYCESRIPRPLVSPKYYLRHGLPHNQMGEIHRRRLQNLFSRNLKSHRTALDEKS